jgi:hypothetical protein
MVSPRRRILALGLTVAAALLSSFNALGQADKRQMKEEEFWACIGAAKTAAGANTEARVMALARQLDSLDLEDIQAFQRRYDQMIKHANRWDLWGAAYLMNGGCSDDCFRYFRDWLISEGRQAFERALSDPDALAEYPRREYFDLESFGYVARKAFAAKTGGRELELDYSGELGQPAGKRWSEAELPSLFPRLAAKYLGK